MWITIEEEAALLASMTIARRLGVDLSGTLEEMAPRVRAAIDAWKAKVGTEVADREIADVRRAELAALTAKRAAQEKAKADAESAQRWATFDGDAEVVTYYADRLDLALAEAASARAALTAATASALGSFPGDPGLAAFLERRALHPHVERAALRAGAGESPDSLAEPLRASLRTLATLRHATAGAA